MINCKNIYKKNKVKGRIIDQFLRVSERFELFFSKLKLKGRIFLHTFVVLYVRSLNKFFFK